MLKTIVWKKNTFRLSEKSLLEFLLSVETEWQRYLFVKIINLYTCRPFMLTIQLKQTVLEAPRARPKREAPGLTTTEAIRPRDPG